MKLHKDSHVDHALSEAQLKHLLALFAEKAEFFIETVVLPEGLGTVSCGLHGPIMGDSPVPGEEVRYAVRGERRWTSRLCDRGTREVRQVTVIAGPHDGEACVLFTAFGGPLAPQEPGDASCKDLAASEEFWSKHALSA